MHSDGKLNKEFYERMREIISEYNINTVAGSQQPRHMPTVWKPRTRSLQQEYEEGMRKIDPNWTPPKDDVVIVDYISIMP